MNSADPNQTNQDNQLGSHDATLHERSARLEAEAAMGHYDHLSPEPVEGESGESGSSAADTDTAALEAMQAELDQAKEQMLRAVADAENTRRRAVREREDASKYAVSGFARDVLNVADNLRRALDTVPQDDTGGEHLKALVQGIEATERELLRALEKNGVQKTDPLGELFDPNLHEVMFETPGTGQAAGTVIQVIQTGYVLNGRLLRPAQVGVAKDEGQGDAPSGGTTVDTEV